MFDDHTEISLSALNTNANKEFYMQTGVQPPEDMVASAKGSENYAPVDGKIRVTQRRYHGQLFTH